MKKNFFHEKLKIYFRFFIITMLCIVCINAYSQKPKLCGGYKINTNELSKALQFEKSNKPLSSQHYLIRVYFHIVRYDDGSHAGATSADIQNEFQTLQSDYAPGNICFLNAGLNYINNTTLDTANVDNTGNSLFTPYQVANCINIFYTLEINGNNGNCNCGIGGIAFSIPGTLCAIAKSNIGAGRTISHEVGHCLGLLHTFDSKNGYEDIDGSNSATAGDQIVDTHADPYAFAKQSCFNTFGSVYIGDCTDPKGQKNYDPPYTNLMAYWWTYGYINLFNTSGQFTRINSFLNTNSSLQACESPDNVTLSNVNYSSGYLLTSAANSLATAGTVNLSGTTIATLGGQSVYLENGFSAIPLGGGLISIEPASCGSTFNTLLANNTIRKVNSDQPIESSKLLAYPNPASSIIHLDFSTEKYEKSVMIKVYDMEMKQTKEIRLGDLANGKQSVGIDLSSLPSGIYILSVQLQSQKLMTKVSLVK